MPKEETMEGLGNELPYDLRQVYAIEILGEHLKDVARARKSDNFPIYFKCLKDVWIVSQHKFKKGKYTIYDDKNKKIEISKGEYFNLILEKISKLANEYPSDWLGTSKNENAIAEIEQALNTAEMFLYKEIEDAKIFGSNKNLPGL